MEGRVRPPCAATCLTRWIRARRYERRRRGSIPRSGASGMMPIGEALGSGPRPGRFDSFHPDQVCGDGRTPLPPKERHHVRLVAQTPCRRSANGGAPSWYDGGSGSTPDFGSSRPRRRTRRPGSSPDWRSFDSGRGRASLDGIRMVRKPVASGSVPVACEFDSRPIRLRKCKPIGDGTRPEPGRASRPWGFDSLRFRSRRASEW